MKLTNQVVKNIIQRLINGKDYRIEIVALINAEFLQFTIDFFKKVVNAKINNLDVSIDWYKNSFLTDNISTEDYAINSGLNKKTITNMYNSGVREVVIDAANEHYEVLSRSIENLIENEQEIDLKLTIKFHGVSVELSINESLLLINTLAVKRAALRGGLWSTAGKSVEKYLMKTLCELFEVPEENYNQKIQPKSMREVDFYLVKGDKFFKCEVKLMGRGNPESADAIFARESNVFIADKLSDLNKEQADKLGVKWVELRDKNGYKRFAKVLKELEIPYSEPSGSIDNKIDKILAKLLE